MKGNIKMKKILLAMFLLINFKAHSYKVSFEPPLNIRVESMGKTGMIFGKEYGALYFSPISSLSFKKIVTGGLEINGYLNYVEDKFNQKIDAKSNLSLYLQMSNFVLGTGTSLNLNKDDKRTGRGRVSYFLPASYTLEIGDFAIGVALKYANISNIIVDKGIELNRSFDGFASDLALSYKTLIGDFAISINNLVSLGKSVSNEKAALMRNLKLGYGKEFRIGYIIDSIKAAFELDNLLMEEIYVSNSENGDYSWFRKPHLGFEISSNLANIIYLDGRMGLKNLFPTLGFSISIGHIFTFDYAFTNQDFGKEWGKNRVLLNAFSFSLGYFE